MAQPCNDQAVEDLTREAVNLAAQSAKELAASSLWHAQITDVQIVAILTLTVASYFGDSVIGAPACNAAWFAAICLVPSCIMTATRSLIRGHASRKLSDDALRLATKTA